MKIRTDFVTNSSSSSFILIFDDKPQNVYELHKKMFYDSIKDTIQKTVCPYDDSMSTFEIADIVFGDITGKDESYNVWKEIESYLSSVVYHLSYLKSNSNTNTSWYVSPNEAGAINVSEFISDTDIPYDASYMFKERTGKQCYGDATQEEKEKYKIIQHECWKEYKKQAEKCTKKIVAKMKKKYKDKFISVVSYSDETTQGSIMEHGGIFKQIPHIYINCH